jgi:transposase
MPTMTYPATASEQAYIEVTGGVDTHKDTHTAAALDASGRLLGHREFAATAAGYAALLAWLGTLGQLVRVGVEGSGVYGAGLARFLQAAGVELVEVDRPDRKTRRWQGKSDPVDAEAAARAAQAGRASGVPKTLKRAASKSSGSPARASNPAATACACEGTPTQQRMAAPIGRS